MADKPLVLSEVRVVLEKEIARNSALLGALEVLEGAESAERKLSKVESDIAEAQGRLDQATRALAVAEAAVPIRKKAADDEVAAERSRLQQELAKARTDLAETQRQRREEHDGRERDSRVHRELVAQRSRDDLAVSQQTTQAHAKHRAALDLELARLRGLVEASKADLESNQQATRDLAARLAQAAPA